MTTMVAIVVMVWVVTFSVTILVDSQFLAYCYYMPSFSDQILTEYHYISFIFYVKVRQKEAVIFFLQRISALETQWKNPKITNVQIEYYLFKYTSEMATSVFFV